MLVDVVENSLERVVIYKSNAEPRPVLVNEIHVPIWKSGGCLYFTHWDVHCYFLRRMKSFNLFSWFPIRRTASLLRENPFVISGEDVDVAGGVDHTVHEPVCGHYRGKMKRKFWL